MSPLFLVTLRFEAEKLRRSNVVRIATLILVFFPVALAAGGVTALRTDLQGAFAAKASLLVQGEGWNAYLGLCAQVLSVAVLLGAGFVCAWTFGREFEQNTIVNLFGLSVGRRDFALAKCLTLIAWVLIISVFVTIVTLVVGVALGPMSGSPNGVWLPFLVSVLSGLNALPLAWVATVRRSYLPAIAVLLGIVVMVQLLMIIGVGAWFPWSVPGLLAGFSPTLRPTFIQCLLPLVVAVISIWATLLTWARLELGRS